LLTDLLAAAASAAGCTCDGNTHTCVPAICSVCCGNGLAATSAKAAGDCQQLGAGIVQAVRWRHDQDALAALVPGKPIP
jgi:hypothetical protein